MQSTHNCPRDGCDYSGNEHGLKTHLSTSHEDSKYGRVSLSCNTCGSEFSRKRSEVKSGKTFCSRKCKNNFNKEYRECAVCGTTKLVDSSAYEHKYGWVCSKECNKNQYREEVECVICGETKIERQKQERKFPYRCSKECTEEWVKVDTDCSYCGTSYIANRHHIDRYKNTYCSDECFYKSQRVENYNNAQHQRWAKEVKEREEYTCVDCGESHDVMCAHHDPPREELSKEEETNPENGVCLCYPCHAERHTGAQRTVLLSWWEWYSS